MKKNYTDQEYMYFVLLNKAIELVLSYSTKHPLSPGFLKDIRNINDIKTSSLQVKEGLILKIDLKNKYPISIFSMFGEWKCFEIGKNQKGWKRKILRILKQLNAKDTGRKSRNFVYYSITNVNGTNLPEATLFFQTNMTEKETIETAAKWINIKKMYLKRMKGAATQKAKNR